MREFRIGEVLRRAAGLLGARPGLLLGATLLLVAAPQAGGLALVRPVAAAHPALATVAGFWYSIGGLLVQAVTTRIALDATSGRRSGLRELAGAAASVFLPILAISLLAALVTGAASLLLLVPGLMVMCRWYVALPVGIAERPGILAAFGRSGHLTKGVRWRILGLILVVAVLGFVLIFISGFLGVVFLGLSAGPWPGLIGQALGTALITLFGALANTAAYLTLREIKEGRLSRDVVAEFE